MNPVTVTVEVSDEMGKLDPTRLRSAQKKVSNLIKGGKPVLVKVLQGNSGKTHLEHARKYSKDVSSVRREIRGANALLVITTLRAAKVPTHATAFENEKSAKKFLKNNLAAAVV